MYSKKEFIKDRNEAFASGDKETVIAYCNKYGIEIPDNEEIFEAGIHKVICNMYIMEDSPITIEQYNKSYDWLIEHGLSPLINVDNEDINEIEDSYSIPSKYAIDILNKYGSIEAFEEVYKKCQCNYNFNNDIFCGFRGIIISKNDMSEYQKLQYALAIKDILSVDISKLEFNRGKYLDIDEFEEQLTTIPERRQKVIRYFYALEGKKNTYDEIANIWGISKSRVGQILKDARIMLSRPYRSKNIVRDYKNDYKKMEEYNSEINEIKSEIENLEIIYEFSSNTDYEYENIELSKLNINKDKLENLKEENIISIQDLIKKCENKMIDSFKEIDIYDLNFSERTYNCLNRGIKNLYDLLSFIKGDFSTIRIRNFGENTQKEVINRLTELGIYIQYDSFTELELSVRSYNCLKRAGIMNLNDLLNLTQNELLKVEGLGHSTYNEIINKISIRGLTLKKEGEEINKKISENTLTNIINNFNFYKKNRLEKLEDIISKKESIQNKIEKYYKAVEQYLDYEDIFNSKYNVPAINLDKKNVEVFDDVKKVLDELIIISNDNAKEDKGKIQDEMNDNPEIEQEEKNTVYAKLYEDGTLILSSYDYIDVEKKLIKDYNFENIPSEDKQYIENIVVLDKIIVSPNNYFIRNCFKDLKITKLDLRNLDFSNIKNMSKMFYRCENLEELKLSNFNISKVENMGDLFYECENLKKLDISNLDFSNIEDMRRMFWGFENLEELKLSGVNTSQIIDMGEMFGYCTNLKKIDLSNFDTSNVQYMDFMFYKCRSLEELNLSNFDTSNVINMNGMFMYCENLEELNLSSFNTSNVTNMNKMFNGCQKLKKLNVSVFNTSNVTDMNEMFMYCNNLEELNLSNFNTSNAINMNSMFYKCVKLKELDLSSFNTSSVQYMKLMFYRCESLGELNLSNFDTSKAIDMSAMFNKCIKLKEINLSNFNTSNTTNMNEMFNGCENLEEINVSNFDTSKVLDMSAMFYRCVKLKELDLSSFNVSNVTNMHNMFSECESLEELNLSNFNTPKATDMSAMFDKCTKLKKIDLSNFDTSNVQYMYKMFSECENLKELSLSSFNTFKVINMSKMFYRCKNLEQLNLSNFDTSNVKDMSSMFRELENLKKLNLSNFNTSNVEDMSRMFMDCENLEQLNLSNFDTSNVKDMSGMFRRLKKIKELDLSSFNTSKVKKMNEMFKYCENLEELNILNFDTSKGRGKYSAFDGCKSLNEEIKNYFYYKKKM